MDEKKLALLISHELSHYLLDHQAARITKVVFNEYIYRNYFRTKEIEIYDPIKEDFK